MALKAALLDLDDTLVDFLKMKRNSVMAAAKAMRAAGLKMSEQEAFEKIFAIYEKHGWEDQKAFQRLLHKTSGKIDYKILAHGILAYRKEKTARLALHDSVKETLNALKAKGLKLGIVTDAPKLQAYTRLVALGIEDYFDAVVCFEDTRAYKPSELPFKKALSQLGLKPQEVLFVGDWLDRDIIGAGKVGMKTAWAKYGDEEKKLKDGVKPDFVLESFRDLLKIV
ncbi:MAG: HAD-IA family hydrolase [Candidatus Norongarragalinales archaeon]